jgi:argininosuccinate lyase
MSTSKTITGRIDRDVLSFTVGRDPQLDLNLAEADCLGTAAHVTMLSRVPIRPPLLSPRDAKRVLKALAGIMDGIRAGRFAIRTDDQDVHMAVERMLTDRLGHLGKRVHTARSRNDQVAVDLRLYGKEQLLALVSEIAELAEVLLAFARRHVSVPMVGRTHLQPAMPSSVGVWACAYAESLLDDVRLLQAAYDLNNQCPLGSAASYGVPLPIDRKLTARLLGFAAPIHDVLHAGNSRGKCESAILAAAGQVMISLSRLAVDLMLYSTPEFGYFSLPPEYCTGSSIMPQKYNPDILELVRAKATRVLGFAGTVAATVSGLPGGYNRDLQETKEPFMDGLQTTRACTRIMARLVRGVTVNRDALLRGFSPSVFATDRALDLVAGGMPFRDAYQHVRDHLDELQSASPAAAIRRKTHLGASAGLDWSVPRGRVRQTVKWAGLEKKKHDRAMKRLLGTTGSRNKAEESR